MALFDGNLKQRLIGTVVLIVLAVVFLPMIFNNKGNKSPETIVTVPTEPTRPRVPSTAPSDVITTIPNNNQPVINSTTVTAASTTSPEPTTAPTTVAQQNAVTTQNTTPIPNTTPPPTTPPTTTTQNKITPSWTIQVAAVSTEANAEAFVSKLQKANFNAYKRKDGKLYKIFVGPFIEKSSALDVEKLVKKQFKREGITEAFVREFKPEEI